MCCRCPLVVAGPLDQVMTTAEAVVSDASFGLPPSGAPLIQARAASGAVPLQEGDLTIVEQHVTW